VLLNPLVYMSEGMRVSLTPWVQHMSLWGIYGGLIVFTILLGAWGIQGFTKRVLSSPTTTISRTADTGRSRDR
jgi:ABC-2 type transport system permease protein